MAVPVRRSIGQHLQTSAVIATCWNVEEAVMTRLVTHDLAVRPTRNERAAQDFTSSLRGHVLNDMAAA